MRKGFLERVFPGNECLLDGTDTPRVPVVNAPTFRKEKSPSVPIPKA